MLALFEHVATTGSIDEPVVATCSKGSGARARPAAARAAAQPGNSPRVRSVRDARPVSTNVRSDNGPGGARVLTVDEPPAPERTAPPAPRRPWRRSRLSWLAVVVVALVVAGVVWRAADGGPPPVTGGDVDRAVRSGIQKAQQDERDAPTDAATAYRTIAPSLVTIVTAGVPAAGRAPESSLGAGVVVNADGTVVTALHVVSGGGAVQVRFADGTVATGTIVTRQPESDIAVLGVDRLPQIVVPAVMGGGARIGDAVYPVGNPLGLQGSLSAGVVSALGRVIKTEGGQTLKGLI